MRNVLVYCFFLSCLCVCYERTECIGRPGERRLGAGERRRGEKREGRKVKRGGRNEKRGGRKEKRGGGKFKKKAFLNYFFKHKISNYVLLCFIKLQFKPKCHGIDTIRYNSLIPFANFGSSQYLILKLMTMHNLACSYVISAVHSIRGKSPVMSKYLVWSLRV